MSKKVKWKMKKLIIAAGVLAAAFLIATAILIARLDRLITKAVNTYGPEITGTDVRIDDVRMSFLSGEAAVKNFLLGNPKGLRSVHAMKAASITVDLELGSLLGDTIVVKRIEVVQPDIIYEKRGGTDNLKLPTHRAGLPGRERTRHDCAP